MFDKNKITFDLRRGTSIQGCAWKWIHHSGLQCCTNPIGSQHLKSQWVIHATVKQNCKYKPNCATTETNTTCFRLHIMQLAHSSIVTCHPNIYFILLSRPGLNWHTV